MVLVDERELPGALLGLLFLARCLSRLSLGLLCLARRLGGLLLAHSLAVVGVALRTQHENAQQGHEQG